MMRRRLGALLLAAALALGARAARADEAAIVTVVRAKGAGKIVDEATVRLAGELAALGFTVRSIEGSRGADGRAEVEGAGDALATIAILETDGGTIADVWVADHVTKKTLVRRVDLGDTRASNAASDLAVRSTELLRASLLEVLGKRTAALPPAVTRWIEEAAPAPAPPPPPAPPPIAQRAPAPPAVAFVVERRPAPAFQPRAPRAIAPVGAAPDAPGLGIEAGVALFAGGFGVAPAALVRLDLALPKGFSIRAAVLPSVAASRLEGARGSVALRQTAATLDVAYDFLPRAARLHPVIALGGAFYHVAIDGAADAPARGLHEEHATVGLVGAAGLGIRLAPALVLRAELDVVVLASAPAAAIAGEQVGLMGRPAFLPSIGLDVALQ